MTVRILRHDFETGMYVDKIIGKWHDQDRSVRHKQDLLSYLRGLMIPAKNNRGINEDLQFLLDIARIRRG